MNSRGGRDGRDPETLLAWARLLENARVLTFGGILGSAAAAILAVSLPEHVPDALSLRDLIFIGGLAGAVVHRFLAVVLDRILGPYADFANFYFRIVQVRLLRERIGQELHDEIVKQMTVDYFLGKGGEDKFLPRV